MDIAELQKQQSFHIHQKITMMVNRYHVYVDNDGDPGELVAFVEQKRMKIKEQVTLYVDESKTAVLGGFKARKALDGSEWEFDRAVLQELRQVPAALDLVARATGTAVGGRQRTQWWPGVVSTGLGHHPVDR